MLIYDQWWTLGRGLLFVKNEGSAKLFLNPSAPSPTNSVALKRAGSERAPHMMDSAVSQLNLVQISFSYSRLSLPQAARGVLQE